MPTFSGFSPDLMQFLIELKANNNREWFQANRDRYEETVRGPALEFITAMQAPIARISDQFRVEAKKVGGSLMRIHRDVRFSNDKSPYKTNVGIHFRHRSGADVHAPGFYVHIDPEEIFFGVGTYHPAGDALKAIRGAIDKHQKEWLMARDNKSFRKRYELYGDSLKRAPQGYDPEHPLIDDLKRKDFIGIQYLDFDILTSQHCVKETTAAFKAGAPMLKFLCDALSVDF